LGGLLLADEILASASGPVRMEMVGEWKWTDPSRNEAVETAAWTDFRIDHPEESID